jgi:hypothetical protein
MDYEGFPARATTTMFKGSKSEVRAEKEAKKKSVQNYEDRNKTAVRKDDGYMCRFPRCSCHAKRTEPEVAHWKHKGAGGDPGKQRSEPENLICLCPPRHRESRVSLHAGTVRLEYLTEYGARGAVRWWVDITAITTPISRRQPGDEKWRVLAEEEVEKTKPRRLLALTKAQGAFLELLAEMEA